MLRRLRDRLQPRAAGIGLAFTPDMEDTWSELGEQVDAALKKVGSAVVGSWEVGAAEVARSLVGTEDDKALIERFSDALVPTLAAFQDLHKGCPGAMRAGLDAGRRDGTLAAAGLPLVKLAVGLDERAADGWRKTTDYLEPLFARCADPAAARDAFLAGDEELRAACRRADGVLRDALGRLPAAASLWDGVCDAFDAYQLALTRDLEFALHGRLRGLVEGVRAARG